MGTVTCFFLTPFPRCVLSYRRFTYGPGAGDRSGPACGARTWGCDASIRLGEETFLSKYDGTRELPDPELRADPRWPTVCDHCRQPLVGGEWQVVRDRLFARSDGGPLTTIREAPPGAMWDSAWMYERSGEPAPPAPAAPQLYRGTDGICLTVRLPDGFDWIVDGEANNGTPMQPGWTRSGTVPIVTATPSIATPGYHGFLTNGQLVSC